MAEELRIPDVLELSDGTRVGGVGKWEKLRREEILELFTREVYGRVPFRTKCVKIEPDGAGKKIYNGTVIQQKSRITAIAEHGMFSFPVWLYYPSGVEQSFPVFVYCMLRTQAEQYDLDGEEHMSFVPVEEITGTRLCCCDLSCDRYCARRIRRVSERRLCRAGPAART